MLRTIATKLAFYLTKWESSSEQIESCRYGLEILLYTILSTSLLLLVGIICSLFINTIILIIVYYLNQTFGGGYHAHSHFACFLSMLGGLLVCLTSIVFFCSSTIFVFILTIVSFVYLFMNPLHLHNNKQYLHNKTTTMIRHSRTISSLSIIISIYLFLTKSEYATTVSIGIMASAISRYIGCRQEYL